jgi:hypothetical protein
VMFGEKFAGDFLCSFFYLSLAFFFSHKMSQKIKVKSRKLQFDISTPLAKLYSAQTPDMSYSSEHPLLAGLRTPRVFGRKLPAQRKCTL